MGLNPSLVVRIAGNAAELRKNLKELTGGIEVTTSNMKKMASSLDGGKLLQQAHNIVAAVNEIGGATKLTEAEKARLNATLQKAIEKYKTLGSEAPRAMHDLEEATRRVEPPLTLADKAAGLLKSTFGQFTAANLVSQVVSSMTQRVGEFVATGTKLPAVEASFSRLTGGINQNSGQMLAAMNASTKGMVADYDLMLGANKAMLLGLPVTTESMGELAHTATVLGKAMGQDATKSLDDLITALGRSSPMILDNLGLTVKVGDANEAYAAKLGKTADQLSDADRKMAFYQAALDAAREKTAQLGEQTKTLGEIIETGWTKTGNVVTRSVATMNVGIGNALSSSKNLAMFVGDVISYGPGIATLNAEMRDQIQHAARRTAEVVPPVEKVVDLSKTYADHLATLKEKTASLTDEQKRLILRATELHQSSGDIAKALGIEESAVTAAVEAHHQAADAAKKHADELKKLNTEIAKFASEEFRDLQKIIAGGVGVPNLATLDSNRGAAPFAPPTGLSSSNPAAGLFNSARFMGFGSEFQGQYGATVNEINQRVPGFLSNVVGGIGGGLKHTLLGMTGTDAEGKSLGAAGLFSNIGGGLLSGGLNSLMNLAVGGIGKLVGKLFNSEGKQTNRERDQNITGFTGIADLGKAQEQFKKLAAEAGVTGAAVGQLFDTKKAKVFEQAFADVTAKIKEQQAIVDKYHLTWVDFAGPRRADEFAKSLKVVTGDTEALERAGLSHVDALKKTAQGYVDLAREGIAAGAGIEPALAPVIKQLADMGLLTDDMVQALSGVAADGLPTWQQMQDAAEKYGLKIDGMGARYQQLRITDSAKGLLDDFNLLVKGGVPVANLIGEMGDEVNTFIRQAIAMGTEVPAAMRPMLQQFEDAGLLTDESGQKLKDLSTIKFAQPLETAIQGLIDKMSELIDKIGDVGSAFGGLPDGSLAPSKFSDLMPDANFMAAGGSGRVYGPTVFVAGEAGPEDYSFSGANRTLDGSGGGALLSEVRGLRRDMKILPILMKSAVQQGIA